MAYSDKVVDYSEHPRHVGSLNRDDPWVGTGMVGSPRAGEVIRLQIKVDPDSGLIAQACFKTYGSEPAIAASSLVAQWAHGRTPEAAAMIRNVDIARELALPPVKIHCSILAEDAIKAAVNDYKVKRGLAPLQVE